MPKMAATVVVDGKHTFYVEWDCDHEDCNAQASHALDEVRREVVEVARRAAQARPNGFVVAVYRRVRKEGGVEQKEGTPE